MNKPKLAAALLAVLLSLTVLSTGAAAATYPQGEGLITFSEQSETGDEVLLIRLNYNGSRDQFRAEMYRDAAPNTMRSVQTRSAYGIASLTVSANYFGVIVEPVDGSDFVIDLVGVSNPERVTVTTGVSGNGFSVDISGDRKESLLISTVTDNRINVVRVGVPRTIGEIRLQDTGNSCMLVNDLDLPVQASTSSGTARVQNERRTAPISMECSSGDLIVKASRVEGPVNLSVSSGDAVLLADTVAGQTQLTASSGDVMINADRVEGPVSLTVSSGDAVLLANTVAGQAQLSASSGTVRAQVSSLYDGVFNASSGEVVVSAARIVNSVKATVSSGDLQFALTEHPKNIRFVFDGNENSEAVSLPRGWTTGYTVGNGQPVLHLGVSSGELTLTVD